MWAALDNGLSKLEEMMYFAIARRSTVIHVCRSFGLLQRCLEKRFWRRHSWGAFAFPEALQTSPALRCHGVPRSEVVVQQEVEEVKVDEEDLFGGDDDAECGGGANTKLDME